MQLECILGGFIRGPCAGITRPTGLALEEQVLKGLETQRRCLLAPLNLVFTLAPTMGARQGTEVLLWGERFLWPVFVDIPLSKADSLLCITIPCPLVSFLQLDLTTLYGSKHSRLCGAESGGLGDLHLDKRAMSGVYTEFQERLESGVLLLSRQEGRVGSRNLGQEENAHI